MERQYKLSVTSDATDINVLSVNADEVARIVQLAGIIEPSKPTSTVATAADPIAAAPVAGADALPADAAGAEFNTDMDVMRKNAGMAVSARPAIHMPDDTDDGMAMDTGYADDAEDSIDDDIDDGIDDTMQQDMDEMLALEEDVAEYDYGHRKFKDEGEEVDEIDLVWQAVENPQRIKGSPGDNGLIQELHNKLASDYAQYLAETERENDTGVMSPLSDPTKPSFDKDPLSDEEPIDDGSHSPMSTIVRQYAFK